MPRRGAFIGPAPPIEALGAATFPGFRKWAGIAFRTLVVIAVLTDFPVRRRAAT